MRVWVDIDNAPHVAFFRPVIAEMAKAGADVRVTARGRTFVPEMLEAARIDHSVIGRGQPRGLLGKATTVAGRAMRLAHWARRHKFDVAVGHGSRSLPLAARVLGIPNLTTYDYEHVASGLFTRLCDRIVVPKIVHQNLAAAGEKWRFYDGFKEEIYLDTVRPDPTYRTKLGIPSSSVLVVMRPASRTAHYHDRRSEEIESEILQRLGDSERTHVVWLRRDPSDQVPSGKNILAPEMPLDGASLISAADLVISGGGTMIREAALLGVPSYSIFMGRLGAVDAELARRGWLTIVRGVEDVRRIAFVPKCLEGKSRLRAAVRGEFIHHIIETARPGAALAEEGMWRSPSSI